MPSSVLTEWLAFDSMDPFGRDRLDLGFAIVSSTIANVNRKKGSRRFSPEDFMPKFEKRTPRRRQGWREQLSMVEVLNTAFGGKDLREKDATTN